MSTHATRRHDKPRNPAAPLHRGRLEWRMLIGWLREDGLIGDDDVDRVSKRLSAGDSTLHALVRLGGAGLVQGGEGAHAGRPLDTEALTEWLAQRAALGNNSNNFGGWRRSTAAHYTRIAASHS